MLAKDIMTTKVVTVVSEAPVAEIADLLLARRISGVPVVDSEDRLVRIVSEGDLIRRQQGEGRRSWWLSLLTSPDESAREYIKTHGQRAEDVMTRDVVTVTEETPLGEIAQLLEKRGIKRVPVLREGKVVGIVSRANLLHGLAAQKDQIPVAPSPDDRTIREQVIALVERQGWATHGSLNVIVADGVVELWGWVDSDEERKALKIAAEGVAGVGEVQDHLALIAPYLRGT